MLRLGENRDYTYSEIMEQDYNQLWCESQKYVEHLTLAQENIVKMMPEYKTLLPNKYESLQDKKAQINLLNYIRLRSIYTFADKAFKVLDTLCKDLVNAEGDDIGIMDVSSKIEALFHISLDDFITDEVTGFMRLYIKWKELKGKSIIKDWTVFGKWTFGDIAGSISDKGMCYKKLWQETINDSIPKKVSIGKLLDSDELIRIY